MDSDTVDVSIAHLHKLVRRAGCAHMCQPCDSNKQHGNTPAVDIRLHTDQVRRLSGSELWCVCTDLIIKVVDHTFET